MTQACSLFASRSVTRHLLRGGGAALAFSASMLFFKGGSVLAFSGGMLAALLALMLLRGCPMCWTIGLVETIQARRSSRTMDAVGDHAGARSGGLA